jgi:hypothetical protein
MVSKNRTFAEKQALFFKSISGQMVEDKDIPDLQDAIAQMSFEQVEKWWDQAGESENHPQVRRSFLWLTNRLVDADTYFQILKHTVLKDFVAKATDEAEAAFAEKWNQVYDLGHKTARQRKAVARRNHELKHELVGAVRAAKEVGKTIDWQRQSIMQLQAENISLRLELDQANEQIEKTQELMEATETLQNYFFASLRK